MKEIVIKKIDKYMYELYEDFEIFGYTIPKGFKTDGATIPSIFRLFEVCPFVGKYVEVAVLHDYLFSKDCPLDVSFKKANLLFYRGMLKLKVNKNKAKIMYYLVSKFGKGYFRTS